jgi:hypothetical protein
VGEVNTAIHLRRKAEEIGLGHGDDPEDWLVKRLPWN